ncbi:hypothetical protein PNX04_06465 [[Ruminococcus] gnavus]|uniref:hypothetical protein n=2 Tax=Bacillota TaxID=1239 RepID=UPI00232FE93A|nr:hypothetical protein [Mediterraneibacter gnavus]MDB8706654.1 hypothetical protein [Mediterraneibacter gnavus]
MKEDFYKVKTAYDLCKEMCSGIGLEISKSSVYEDNNNIEISSYEILARNKVIRIFFSDGTQEKVTCDDKDKFDLQRGLFVALSKKMYKDKYTLEGIEHMATELSYQKKYVKMVNKAIKDHNKKLIEEENKKHEEILQKKLAYERKVKRDKKKRERMINIQKEAYVRAMKEIGDLHKERGEKGE